jgi:hypothetical protein
MLSTLLELHSEYVTPSSQLCKSQVGLLLATLDIILNSSMGTDGNQTDVASKEGHFLLPYKHTAE